MEGEREEEAEGVKEATGAEEVETGTEVEETKDISERSINKPAPEEALQFNFKHDAPVLPTKRFQLQKTDLTHCNSDL